MNPEQMISTIQLLHQNCIKEDYIYLRIIVRNLNLDIGSTVGISPLYNGISYYTRISPRYRINDQISLKYVLSS